MQIKFTKMHGLGNDFVVIDAVTQNVRVTPSLARRIANRHTGIGCDQVLVVEPPTAPENDFRYRIFNHDGSEVEQCGNGARCFARFVRDRNLTGKDVIKVETKTTLLELKLLADKQVCVDMGVPEFEPSKVPFQADQRAERYTINIDGNDHSFSVLSMGNPHAVLEVDSTSNAPVQTLGPLVEHHPRFPNRVNVGFMQVVNQNEINLRVFERGAGETQACGTGACAAVVAGIQRGLLHSPVTAHLTGGILSIAWQGDGHPVMMTGPAETVFQGFLRL